MRHQQLVQALDEEFLGLVDWAWDLRVVTFPKEHPVLGIADCPVPGCVRGRTGGAVCDACTHRWKASGIALEEFVRLPSPGNRVVGQLICEVPGCPRPRLSPGWRLCSGHHYQRTAKLELTVEAFLAHPKVVPLTAPDVCQVASCFWLCDGPGTRYCRAHQARLAAAKRDGHSEGDEPKWQATETSPAIDRRVSLRGLPERLVAELLYGLQVRTESEIRTWDYTLRQVANRLRSMQATDIETLSDERVRTCGMSDLSRGFILSARSAARRLGSDPETECRKDVWDMAVFGHGGRLHFTKIDQPALREAAKIWAYDELPRRRGKKVTSAVQIPVNSLGLLSESLRLQRPDQGRYIEQWSRQDIVAFLNRLAYLQHSGAMSHRTRQTTVEYVRHVLNRMRAMSLTRPGQPLAGLPQDFTLGPGDVPDDIEDEQAGKDLPDEVLSVLCASLDLLEQTSNREVRVATELLIDTGRRPDEICQLDWDCLRADPDGQPVLLYDNHKAYRLGRRLPIAATTAKIITEQQERVRARYPDTPLQKLKLLPSTVANPHGTKPIAGLRNQHRTWVTALPEIHTRVTVETGGRQQIQSLPFDKSKIVPYAYRYTYAQRHADAGVPPDVLRALMDHRHLSTTQIYYRVSQERRRKAVDRLSALQFDRHGNRVWRKAQTLLDSEHARRAVGEVATAYGVCREPTNVAAAGQACPIRFRCVGCDHFHTDVSYLPDLERYLADLLRSRERLIAAFEADEWARTESMPSEEEISRVRRLIGRVKADLDDLTPEDRARIEEAVTFVRRGRTVMLGLPKVGQPVPDVRPWSSSQ